MWKMVFQNLWFKLVAVVMALFLWFHVATDKDYEYSDRFPLEIVGIPEPLLLAEKLPDYANVTIRGKGKELLKLKIREKDSLRIDLKEFGRGDTDYLIKPEDVPLPEGLELRVTTVLPPKKLKIRLDYPMEKKLPVRPEVSVLPAEGFVQVGEVHYNPKEVMISGPRMWVRNLGDIHTQEKVIENATQPVSEQIDLMLPEGYNLKLSQRNVSYSVNVERIVERQISNLPVKTTNLPRRAGVMLQPDSVDLTVAGAQSLVDQVHPDSIAVMVNCAGVSRGDTVRLPVSVNLPAGIRLVKVEADSVEALIK